MSCIRTNPHTQTDSSRAAWPMIKPPTFQSVDDLSHTHPLNLKVICGNPMRILFMNNNNIESVATSLVIHRLTDIGLQKKSIACSDGSWFTLQHLDSYFGNMKAWIQPDLTQQFRLLLVGMIGMIFSCHTLGHLVRIKPHLNVTA